MNLFHLLQRSATTHSTLPGVALGAETVFTYGALCDRALRIGAALTSRLGLAGGDRVAIISKNLPEYFEIMWGCWAAGLVAVPVNAKLHAKEFEYILSHSGAAVCFASHDLGGAVNEAAAGAPELREIFEIGSRDYRALFGTEPVPHVAARRDDVAWLFYTSGTTGRPKGAMLTHGNLLAMTTSYFLDVDRISPGDAILHAAPLSHGSGLYNLPNVAMGSCQVVPASGGFDPAEICSLIAAWPGTSMFGAPTMVHRLVGFAQTGDPDFSNLRALIYGGAPMHVADVGRALDVLGPRLAQLYGQGEAPMCITALSREWFADRARPGWEEIVGSAGFPQSVAEVRVVDGEDRALPVGEPGEICVRGSSVMKGYWRQPDATAETLKGGWLHTGDVGTLSRRGFLTLMDRSKDMIISGGSNIYPREVEEVLLTHPLVSEVSVVGAPDPEWGENVVAFVVTRDGAAPDSAALDTHVTGNIARFKRPKRYVFVEALPKSNYGKILKRELREQLACETAES
jgi:long-chain acyl-CoA synthetase